MKVLLDECVDRRLVADVQGHDVTTVPEAGWAVVSNGDLLSRAQHEFDALVIKALHLEVERHREPALALYRRAGFEDPDRHLMTKRLA